MSASKDNSKSGGEQGDGKTNMVFRPPIVRSGANALNRALFSKRVNLAAAAVNDNRSLSKYRKALQSSRELLLAGGISPITAHPDLALASQGRKCLLLHPDVKAEGELQNIANSYSVSIRP